MKHLIKFTTALLLLTAITWVMFIGCNNDDEDKNILSKIRKQVFQIGKTVP